MRSEEVIRFALVSALLCWAVPANADALKLEPTLKQEAGKVATLSEVAANCKKSPNQPYCLLRCQYSNIICVDANGAPIPSEEIPISLDPRSTIQLYVLKEKGKPSNVQIKITEVIGKDPADRLTIKPDAADKGWHELPDTGGWESWGATYTMTADADSERFEFSAADDESKLSTFIVRSNGGYFYYSFGPMLAVPWHGTQKIIAAQPPTGTTDRYARVYDTDVVPAFAVHVYPVGHRAQSSSPIQGLTFAWPGIKNFLRDALSIEAAVSIVPKEVFDHLFIGGALEPITGFTASIGVGIHRGERYRNGYQDGAFPATSRDSAVEEFAQVAGYVGFGLNQKIFQTVMSAFSAPTGSQESPQ